MGSLIDMMGMVQDLSPVLVLTSKPWFKVPKICDLHAVV